MHRAYDTVLNVIIRVHLGFSESMIALHEFQRDGITVCTTFSTLNMTIRAVSPKQST